MSTVVDLISTSSHLYHKYEILGFILKPRTELSSPDNYQRLCHSYSALCADKYSPPRYQTQMFMQPNHVLHAVASAGASRGPVSYNKLSFVITQAVRYGIDSFISRFLSVCMKNDLTLFPCKENREMRLCD